MPFSGKNTISVPPGTPVGQVIYRQKVLVTQGERNKARVQCDNAEAFYYGYDYVNQSQLILSSHNTYKTNLQGIGAKFVENKDYEDFPLARASDCAKNIPFCDISDWVLSSDLLLIKTEETVAAGTLLSSSLPVARYSLGQNGSMVPINEIRLSGNLTITAPTCDISPASGSMVVQMGSYKADDFASVNSASAWKNASIVLNCPKTFYGNSGVNTTVWTNTAGATAGTFNGISTTVGTLKNNMWVLTLTPADGIIGSATNGTIKLADADQATTASNIGIQLSKSASTNGIINLSSPVTGTIPNTGVSSITLPLHARYIRTGTPVTAGKAKGKLIYTISYK
jgi:type 1 fimbria pilin